MRLSRIIINALMASLACLIFHACSEEWEKWEVATVETQSTLEEVNDIPYDPMDVRISITANGDWTVTVPEWMKVDKTSGTGNADINVSISENATKSNRTGYIVIHSGSQEPNGNMVGESIKKFTVKQKSKYRSIVLDVVEVNITKKQNNRNNYKGTVTYEVQSELSNEEIASFVSSPKLAISIMGGLTIGGDWTNVQTVWGNWEIDITDISKGRHTINIDEYSRYEVLWKGTAYIKYSVSGSKDMIKGEEFNFSVETIN